MATSDIHLSTNSNVVELEGQKMTTYPAFPYASAQGDGDILTMSFSDLSIIDRLFAMPNVPTTPEFRSPTLPGHYPSSAFRPPAMPLSRPKRNMVVNHAHEQVVSGEGAAVHLLQKSENDDAYAQGREDATIQLLATKRPRQKSQAMEVISSDEEDEVETQQPDATHHFQSDQSGIPAGYASVSTPTLLSRQVASNAPLSASYPPNQVPTPSRKKSSMAMNLLANYANRPPSKRAVPMKLQQGVSQPNPRRLHGASTLIPAASSAAAAPQSSSVAPIIVKVELMNDEVRPIGNSNSHVHSSFRFVATSSIHTFSAPPTTALHSEADQAFNPGDVFVHYTQGGSGASMTSIWLFKEDIWVDVSGGYHQGTIHHPSIPGYVLVPSARDIAPTYILLKSFMGRKRPG